jgi:uncharacterized protein YbjT (DUF2867 family)
MGRIADSGSDGKSVHVAPVLVQPILSDDVAAALADIALAPPANDTVEVAGPERFRLDELVGRVLSAKHDARKVIVDARARYFGAELNDQSLIPGSNLLVCGTQFDTWLSSATPR